MYAGGDGDGDQMQHLLIITAIAFDRHLIGDDRHPTPTKAGPVAITDAVGERLTLQAADGTRFTFDVPTRQWVNP